MWKITKIRVTTQDGKTCDSFGITKGGRIINDISLDYQKISDFVHRLNSLDVSEIHAYELVEDFFGVI